MDSPQIFHPFPRLPAELRLKIWHIAQPERDIIEAHYAFHTFSVPPGVLWAYHAAFYPPTAASASRCSLMRHLLVRAQTVPSIFHVCLESRQVCLAQFTRGVHGTGIDKKEEEVQCSQRSMVTRIVQEKEEESKYQKCICGQRSTSCLCCQSFLSAEALMCRFGTWLVLCMRRRRHLVDCSTMV